MITVRGISGFATVQDSGRLSHGADAVPRSGAMDLDSFARANELVGNQRGAAAVEWGLAGGSVELSVHAAVAVTGARVELSRNGTPLNQNERLTFAAGDELTVGRFLSGAFIYIAVRGGIDVPMVLGSRSTYTPGAFGGFQGRRLRAGDILRIGSHSDGPTIVCAVKPHASENRAPFRVIEGPDTSAFTPEFRESFWSSEFTVSRSSSRAGYRLDRQADTDPGQRSLPSAPACVGAIQVPDGKSAIVLMKDGPTVGGYPKIGVVASVDLGRLAQRTPGHRVTFERISVRDAQQLLRDRSD